MNKIVQKQLHEFFRDVTALGGFAASLLIILLFISSSLLFPLVAGSVITAVLVIIIRIFYFKPRPKKEEYTSFLEKIDASAFPSLHATRMVFLALLFGVHYANAYLTVLFTTVAALVSYSRIYLKKHDWWDVGGGIIVGIIAYLLTSSVF